MLTSGEINVIGNILDTTCGRSSTHPGSYPYSSVPAVMQGSVKSHLVTETGPEDTGGVKLVITYTDFVTFRSDQEVQAQVKNILQVAEKICATRIEGLKKEFR